MGAIAQPALRLRGEVRHAPGMGNIILNGLYAKLFRRRGLHAGQPSLRLELWDSRRISCASSPTLPGCECSSHLSRLCRRWEARVVLADEDYRLAAILVLTAGHAKHAGVVRHPKCAAFFITQVNSKHGLW